MHKNIYKNIIQNMPYGYSCHKLVVNDNDDYDFEFVEINKSYEKYTGLLSNQVIRRRLSEIKPEIYGQSFDWANAFHKVKNGQVFNSELFVESDNQYYKIIISSEDEYIITHIMQQNKGFCSFTQQQCFNRLNIVPIIIIDVMFNIYRTNKLWNDLFGESYSFDKNKNFMDFLNPEDLHSAGYKLKSIDDLNTTKIECKLLCNDGKYKDTELQGTKRGKFIYLLARDVSTEKELERELRSTKDNLDSFFKSIGDMAVVGDREGNVLYVNQSVQDKLGYSLQESQKMHVLDFHPLEARQEAVEIFDDMFKNKRKICPLPLIKKDGSLIPVETRVWFGKWDKKDCFFSMSKDLTYEQESLQRLLRIFKVIPAYVCIQDMPTLRFIDVNDSFIKSFGYSEQEIIGKTPVELDVAFEKDFQIAVEDLNKNGYISRRLLDVKKKNGDIIKVMLSGTVIKTQGKEYMMTFMIDITNEIEYKEKLEHKGKLQQLLVKLSSKYINIPLNNIDEDINKSLEEVGKFVGADRTYIFDYDYEKRTTSNTFEWCNELITPEIDNLQDIPMESVPDWIESHHNGKMIYIPDVYELDENESELKNILMSQNIKSLITIPMMNNGICVGFVGFDSVSRHRKYEQDEIELLFVFAQILVNITIRKNQEIALHESKIKAVKASEVKSNFIARVSHEIRTPLNGAMGYLDLLSESATMTRQIDYVNKAKISLNILLKLVDDLRDISKIEANKLEVRNEYVDIRKVISDAITPLLFEANRKGISINVNIGADIPVNLSGDPYRIKEVIYNILSNSIKYTNKGTVIINCSLESKINDKVNLIFYVRDTGEGISKNEMPYIFDSFFQGKNSSYNSINGMGLGLSICKELVLKMGGRIWVESEIGKGTTFYFTITMGALSKQNNSNNLSMSKDKELQGIKVLIAEDNEINRDMAKEMLTNKGIEADTANNGAEVIDAIKHNEYDVILMDVHMPVMDGLEATKIIREDNGYSDIPIIAMTAAVMLEDRELFLSSGFNSIVEKPLHLNLLLNEIHKLTKEKKSEEEFTAITHDSIDSVSDNDKFDEKTLLVDEKYKKLLSAKAKESGENMIQNSDLSLLNDLMQNLNENNLDAFELIKVAKQKKSLAKFSKQIKYVEYYMNKYDFQHATEELNKLYEMILQE